MQIRREGAQRLRTNPRIGKDLMHKTKVTRFEKLETHFRIGVNVTFVIKGDFAPNQVSTIKDGVSRLKHIYVVQKMPAANLAANEHRLLVGQSLTFDFLPLHNVGSYQADRRKFLSYSNHSLQALGKHPV